jgi:hypothetical protein
MKDAIFGSGFGWVRPDPVARLLVDFGRLKRTREGFCFRSVSTMSGEVPRTYADQLAIG